MILRKTLLFLLIFLAFKSTIAQNKIELETSDAKTIINKNIYGHFAEHLGRCIYDGFYVGEGNKNIPNTAGVRNDIIASLKKLKVPILRWPGGCFADTYHWKDGIGEKAKRPSMVNTWWGNVTEDNSFGTHDFLNMCKEIGAEPYLAGNVGSGEVQELADWVQYVNYDTKSPMSDLRRKNGQDKPWRVKYWGVGNEAWGCGGTMTVEYYKDIYRKYATFMSNAGVEGGLFKIASGANDADYHWTEALMRDIPHHLLSGVALHHYSVIDWNHKGSATDFDEEQYFITMQKSLLMDELVTKHSAIMDKYDPEKKVALVVDEWGGWYDVEPGTNPGFLYQQNTMRDAMIAGSVLNIFNNHADRVKLACLAQAVNVLQAVILTKGDKIIETPTYHVMEMYNVHQDATLIPLKVESEDYTMGDKMLKAVSASASKDKNGWTHLSLVNIDPHKSQTITIDLGQNKYSVLSGRILKSPKLQDYNSFENPDKIKPTRFTGAKLKTNILSVELPPFSVVVLEMK